MKTLKTAAACAALMMTLAGASAQAFAAGTSSQPESSTTGTRSVDFG